ncbi:MAG: hypothetical protein AAGD05_05845 [Bacteroidota bacterium]
MIRLACFIFFVFLLFGGCQNADSAQAKASQTGKSGADTEANATTPPTRKVSDQQYPGVPVELVQEMWRSCDYVDYTFYRLPMSMSFDNQASIQRVLQHLIDKAPVITEDCKPTGRAYFQRQGEDMAVVEFYLHKDCNYFVFLEDGKPKYANHLSQEGYEFYQNSIKQAMDRFNQQQNTQ